MSVHFWAVFAVVEFAGWFAYCAYALWLLPRRQRRSAALDSFCGRLGGCERSAPGNEEEEWKRVDTVMKDFESVGTKRLRDTFSKALPYLDIYAMPESAVWLNAFISRVWCSLYNRCSTTLRAIAAYQQAKRCVSSTDINVSLDDEEELKRLKELVDQSWLYRWLRKRLHKELLDLARSWIGCLLLEDIRLKGFSIAHHPPIIKTIHALRNRRDATSSVIESTCPWTVEYEGELTGGWPFTCKATVNSFSAKVYGRITRSHRAWGASLMEYPNFDLDLDIEVSGKQLPKLLNDVIREYFLPWKIRRSYVRPNARLVFQPPHPTKKDKGSNNEFKSSIPETLGSAKSAKSFVPARRVQSDHSTTSIESDAAASGSVRARHFLTKMSSYKEQIKGQIKQSSMLQKAKQRVYGISERLHAGRKEDSTEGSSESSLNRNDSHASVSEEKTKTDASTSASLETVTMASDSLEAKPTRRQRHARSFSASHAGEKSRMHFVGLSASALSTKSIEAKQDTSPSPARNVPQAFPETKSQRTSTTSSVVIENRRVPSSPTTNIPQVVSETESATSSSAASMIIHENATPLGFGQLSLTQLVMNASSTDSVHAPTTRNNPDTEASNDNISTTISLNFEPPSPSRHGRTDHRHHNHTRSLSNESDHAFVRGHSRSFSNESDPGHIRSPSDDSKGSQFLLSEYENEWTHRRDRSDASDDVDAFIVSPQRSHRSSSRSEFESDPAPP